jgi:hypothetical protein
VAAKKPVKPENHNQHPGELDTDKGDERIENTFQPIHKFHIYHYYERATRGINECFYRSITK